MMPEHKSQSLARRAAGRTPTSASVRAADEPDAGPTRRMLAGITAEEDDQLQRGADAVERRMLGRRIKNPAKVVAGLRSALRQAGWIGLRLKWCGPASLLVTARIGARLKAKLGSSRFISVNERLFGDFIRAVRQVGLKPGIEDISVHVNGRRIEGAVSAVPMADSSAVLDRMVERWRDQRRAKADSSEKATGVKGPGYPPAWPQPRQQATNLALG
jgi:hypothetical protein